MTEAEALEIAERVAGDVLGASAVVGRCARAILDAHAAGRLRQFEELRGISPLSREEVVAIEGRLVAATPGPWKAARSIVSDDGPPVMRWVDIIAPPGEGGLFVASTHLDAHDGEQEEADAALIAQAPTDLRRLLDAAKWLAFLACGAVEDGAGDGRVEAVRLARREGMLEAARMAAEHGAGGFLGDSISAREFKECYGTNDLVDAIRKAAGG